MPRDASHATFPCSGGETEVLLLRVINSGWFYKHRGMFVVRQKFVICVELARDDSAPLEFREFSQGMNSVSIRRETVRNCHVM